MTLGCMNIYVCSVYSFTCGKMGQWFHGVIYQKPVPAVPFDGAS